MRYSKSWTQALQEVQEQTGVRKVDFVDGITPDLQEAKPEFEVKYASSKKGPIKVSKFMSMDDAKEFLAQVKKDGMNGIISKGGKPVKEDHHEKDANGEPIPHDDEEGLEEARKSYDDKEMRKKLKTPKHANRKTAGDEKKERELAQRKRVGLEQVEVDEKASDYEDQIKAFLAKGGKIQKGDKPDKKKIEKITKSFLKSFKKAKDKEAELDAKDKEELEKMMGEESINEASEKFVVVDVSDDSPTFQRVHAIYDTEKQARASIKKSFKDLKKAYGHDYIALQIVKTSKKQKVNTSYKGDVYADSELGEASVDEKSDYELYHKTFSAAMQHAYAHAKKKGFTVDPQEIDDKVATGPRKPSKGKTNRYILGTDKKKKVHIQVANLDNKKFELNMYIEETEKENMDIEETIKQVVEGSYKKKKMEDASNDKSDDGEGLDKVDPKAVKKKFKDRKDKDIDNDGDTDDSDEYMHKKRKAISKSMEKEETESPLYSHVKRLLRNK